MGQPRPDPPTLPSPFLLLPWFPHLLWLALDPVSGSNVHPSLCCLWLCLWGTWPTRPLNLLFPVPGMPQCQLFAVSSHLSSDVICTEVLPEHYPKLSPPQASFRKLCSCFFVELIAIWNVLVTPCTHVCASPPPNQQAPNLQLPFTTPSKHLECAWHIVGAQ